LTLAIDARRDLNMFGRATPANESYRQGAAGGRKCVVVWYVTGSVGAESGWSDNTLKRP